mmetsp:Transcript_19662/g.40541  ORF Transcript_19662/g.40541 Transcript_19662/m.40541 type:complete len:353 (-) Transcript_19662:930-1988(-)
MLSITLGRALLRSTTTFLFSTRTVHIPADRLLPGINSGTSSDNSNSNSNSSYNNRWEQSLPEKDWALTVSRFSKTHRPRKTKASPTKQKISTKKGCVCRRRGLDWFPGRSGRHKTTIDHPLSMQLRNRTIDANGSITDRMPRVRCFRPDCRRRRRRPTFPRCRASVGACTGTRTTGTTNRALPRDRRCSRRRRCRRGRRRRLPCGRTGSRSIRSNNTRRTGTTTRKQVVPWWDAKRGPGLRRRSVPARRGRRGFFRSSPVPTTPTATAMRSGRVSGQSSAVVLVAAARTNTPPGGSAAGTARQPLLPRSHKPPRSDCRDLPCAVPTARCNPRLPRRPPGPPERTGRPAIPGR